MLDIKIVSNVIGIIANLFFGLQIFNIISPFAFPYVQKKNVRSN